MTNDAAVAWQRRIRGDSGRWLSWCEYDLPDKDEKFPPKIGRWEAQYRPLYSATTVAELRAEVERLRVQLAGCGVIAMSNTRDSLAEQMQSTSAYGWSPSLVEVHDAVFREIQNRERANAAERRVAELHGVLSDAVGRLYRIDINRLDAGETHKLDVLLDRLQTALTKESP